MSNVIHLERFFASRPELPPQPAAGFQAHLPREDDVQERIASVEELSRQFRGMTFGIEYCDSRGEVSRRWITVLSMGHNAAGDATISARCHMRNAARTFRLDRIETVIDANGVVHDPENFFAGLAVLDPDVGRSRERRAGEQYLSAAFDGIQVLCALSHIDGKMHPEEVDLIVDYALACLPDVPATVKDIEAIQRYALSQYPSRTVVREALAQLSRAESDAAFLLKYVGRLIDADGVMTPHEFDLAAEIADRLPGYRLRPAG
jgi:hypothetical protein